MNNIYVFAPLGAIRAAQGEAAELYGLVREMGRWESAGSCRVEVSTSARKSDFVRRETRVPGVGTMAAGKETVMRSLR
jgi:hypothetical protein